MVSISGIKYQFEQVSLGLLMINILLLESVVAVNIPHEWMTYIQLLINKVEIKDHAYNVVCLSMNDPQTFTF